MGGLVPRSKGKIGIGDNEKGLLEGNDFAQISYEWMCGDFENQVPGTRRSTNCSNNAPIEFN